MVALSRGAQCCFRALGLESESPNIRVIAGGGIKLGGVH